MSASVNESFTEIFPPEVKQAYQRESEKLRRTLRNRTVIDADTVHFQKLGAGVASSKARHGDVTLMNLQHSKVNAVMQDFYAAEMVDDLDEIKTNVALRQEYAISEGYALARATDDLIIDVYDGTSNTIAVSAGMSVDVVQEARRRLDESNVAMSGRWAIITPAALNELQDEDQFSSIDYNSMKPVSNPMAMFNWHGFDFIVHTALPLTVGGGGGGNDLRRVFFGHNQAAGLGINHEVSTVVDRIGLKQAHLITSKLSLGGTLIEDTGVLAYDIDEVPLP